MNRISRNVMIALIANFNKARKANSLGVINKFAVANSSYEMDIVCHEWQPSSSRLSIFRYLKRLILVFREEVLFHIWLRRFGAGRFIVASFASLVLSIFRLASPVRGSHLQKATRELALTDKHIRALTTFLESQNQILLVVEDDIQTNLESGLALPLEIWNELGKSDVPVFVSASKAFNEKELGARKLVLNRVGNSVGYVRPFSNTTAAVFLNRALASAIIEVILGRPSLRSLSSDWLLNACFRRLKNISAIHLINGMFINGSLLGFEESSIQI